jgi:hypothetical protein
MHVLPFRLRVPSQDEHTLTEATSTTFKFRGIMRLEPGCLYLEWTGTGKRESHGLLGAESSTTTLPLESIELPLDQIRVMRFLGGWWWPRVVLSAMTLDGLRVVPSEEDGVVKFYIARSDREQAEALIAAVMAERQS